ncbi:MAG: dihydroxy-acid dehydratase, partial [Candidatus Competibacteraceae bacterium]|nr:dihydroxy-acid dehydratase [Candidatus Competibacteraceae bacterium]
SSVPAADANHGRMATACGRRIVDMVWEELTPSKILTKAAFRNASRIAMAAGCSTNAVIHLIAMARRAGVDLTLDDLDDLARDTPVLANIRPSGERYLMEDFYYAGGLQALMKQLGEKLELEVATVAGKSLGETLTGAQVHNEDVIRPLDNPVYQDGAIAVLKGNLAPDGCIIKPSACAPELLRNRGRALVFDDHASLKKAANDP